MSLKIFHIIFTGCTTLLFLFVGVFYGLRFFDSGSSVLLLYSVLSLMLGTGTIFYGKFFLNKYKHLSNL